MGLAANWQRTNKWLNYRGPVLTGYKPAEIKKQPKCPEIPVLPSYKKDPSETFWSKFPYSPFPTKVSSSIDVEALSVYVDKFSDKMSPADVKRAKTVISSLTVGATSAQIKKLPACFVENPPSTLKHGKEITDAVGHWVKKEMAAGPFDSPPAGMFRVNSLVAIAQHGKVRPVLNVSLPEGSSFNDNIDILKLEKVKMSSARKFGYSMRREGLNCNMSKTDLCDAYKLVPAMHADLRLQGFMWLNKFFCETKQIFGARTSVSNFDQLGNVLVTMACIDSNTDKSKAHRHLDDVPFVSSEKNSDCSNFTESYKKICSTIGIKLAAECPEHDKAFSNTKWGKVLGIWFSSSTMSWHLPSEKRYKTLKAIVDMISWGKGTLLEWQKLMGRLNDVSLMCPFLNAYRYNLNKCLSEAHSNVYKMAVLNNDACADLMVWAGMLMDSYEPLPIPSEPSAPPVTVKFFASDAAGFADTSEWKGKIGVATMGLNEEGEFILAHVYNWSKKMITEDLDRDGKRFGNKTAMLEFVGLLLPFMLIPSKLSRQHVVMEVDNISCYFGWGNKMVKEDPYTSVLVRTLHVVTSYLETEVHVVHRPRNTSWSSNMVDRMSRHSTTQQHDRNLLNSFGQLKTPSVLSDWLLNPTVDWSLPHRVLSYVQSIE